MIMCSSEHAFPFRLSDLGFNTDYLNYIFVGELSPCKISNLLVNWGVGRHLRAALIEMHGGHIYDIHLALESIKNENLAGIDPSVFDRVQDCLDTFTGTDKKRMIDVLNQLAVKGFCPLEKSKDKIAEVISKNGVGGVVRSKSHCFGLPHNIFDECDFCLVPAKQATRLGIAKQLLLMEKRRTGLRTGSLLHENCDARRNVPPFTYFEFLTAPPVASFQCASTLGIFLGEIFQPGESSGP